MQLVSQVLSFRLPCDLGMEMVLEHLCFWLLADLGVLDVIYFRGFAVFACCWIAGCKLFVGFGVSVCCVSLGCKWFQSFCVFALLWEDLWECWSEVPDLFICLLWDFWMQVVSFVFVVFVFCGFFGCKWSQIERCFWMHMDLEFLCFS